MVIVDSQVHIWGHDAPERPWPPGGKNLRHKYYTADALVHEMDIAGVDCAVLVPPVFEGDRNDVALAAAARFPDRLAVMGRLALDLPQSREQLAHWRDTPGMLGIRQSFFTEEHRRLLFNGSTDWFWNAAEAARLPVYVFCPGLLDVIGDVACSHPNLPLVICHFGLAPEAGLRDLQEAPDRLLELARFPNVAVKASALPCHAHEDYPFPSLREPLERVIEGFGAGRVFWGSDLTRLPCTYKQMVDFGKQLTFLSTDELEQVMGAGLRNWLRWPGQSQAIANH